MVCTIKEIEERSKKNKCVTNSIKSDYKRKQDSTEDMMNIVFVFSFIILPLIFIITAFIVF